MKLKKGLMLHKTPDGTVAVATGDAAKHFNGMLRLTPTAAFIVERLMTETTVEAVAEAVTAQYEVERATAMRDVEALVSQLTEAGLMA